MEGRGREDEQIEMNESAGEGETNVRRLMNGMKGRN